MVPSPEQNEPERTLPVLVGAFVVGLLVVAVAVGLLVDADVVGFLVVAVAVGFLVVAVAVGLLVVSVAVGFLVDDMTGTGTVLAGSVVGSAFVSATTGTEDVASCDCVLDDVPVDATSVSDVLAANGVAEIRGNAEEDSGGVMAPFAPEQRLIIPMTAATTMTIQNQGRFQTGGFVVRGFPPEDGGTGPDGVPIAACAFGIALLLATSVALRAPADAVEAFLGLEVRRDDAWDAPEVDVYAKPFVR